MTGLDARALIDGDLRELRRERKAHFRGALVLAVLAPALLLLVTGLRGDLLQQPAWLLGLEAVVWLLALVALPAIGLGLWFPSLAARGVLGALALVTAAFVAVGPEITGAAAAPSAVLAFEYCTYLTLGAGALVLAVCAVSGAFAERRRPAAALWLVASVVLVAVDTTTWHCPATALEHTLSTHLAGAVLLLLLAAAAGLALHRGRRSA